MTEEGRPVLVVGAGSAGLAAAIRLGAAGVPVTLVEGNLPGGQLWEFDDVGVVPGVDKPMTGNDLSARLQEQAAASGVGFEFGSVESVGPSDDGGPVTLRMVGGAELVGRAVIAASGTRRTPIVPSSGDEVPEDATTHCIPCDGPLLAGQAMAFVGTAPPLARDLAAARPFASTVTIVDLGASGLAGSLPGSLPGDRVVSGQLTEVSGRPPGLTLTVATPTGTEVIEVGAVVPCLGYQPLSSWLDAALLDADGWAVEPALAPGLWAAGSARRSLVDGSPADVIADGWHVAGLVLDALRT